MQYSGLTLDDFQAKAIEHLQANAGVLVSAPTGTGKTLVADWLVDRALSRGKHVIYTAPIKALSNQKFRDYCRLHGDDRVGLVTGDLVIRRDAPCLVMTTEILRNMLLDGSGLPNLDAVIIDEAHFIDDRDRGTVWEEVLIYLPKHVQILALSATIPNLTDFARWLASVRACAVEVVYEPKRAVPLTLYLGSKRTGIHPPAEFYKNARKLPPATAASTSSHAKGRRGRPHQARLPSTHAIDLFKIIHRQKGLPLLYFVFSRLDTERFAYQLAFRYHAELLNDEDRREVQRRIDEADMGTALTDDMHRMLLHGVGFHHAGMHVRCKTLVESLYESRLLPVLFCTTTFALGINMPAHTVVLHELEMYDGESRKPIRTRDFMQMAGRAGRRGLDASGQVILRLDEAQIGMYRSTVERLEAGRDEAVRSGFSLSFNSIVRLFERHPLARVQALVGQSYLAWEEQRRTRETHDELDTLQNTIQAAGRPPSKGESKRIRKLENIIATEKSASLQDLMGRRDFLVRIGYLNDTNEALAGAKILKHLQIADIAVTELILAGAFEDLTPAELYGVLLALTTDLPRAVSIRAFHSQRLDQVVHRIEQIISTPIVREAARLSRVPQSWSPAMLPVGMAWADGRPLAQILENVSSPTDYAGSLVSGLRRAKELLSQVTDAHHHHPHAESMRALMRSISRDEVEVVG